MSIVNFFFWVMLLLLGTLAGVLVDSFARAEKMALAELNRLGHTTRRQRPSYATGRRLHRYGERSVGCRVMTDDRYRYLEKVSADCHRLNMDQRQPTANQQRKACFFTIDMAAADHQSESNPELANAQKALAYDYTLPHAAGYDMAKRQNEKTVPADCPSCA